jgi:hypothetical protein
MNLRSIAISMMVLRFVSTSADGQSSSPTPPPELKKWDVWIGDWKLSGTARDTPTGPEYKVNWYLHEHWILDCALCYAITFITISLDFPR